MFEHDNLLAPVTLAKSMKGLSLRESTEDRITLATPAHPMMAITNMMFHMFGPITADKMIIKGKAGSTKIISVKRMRTESIAGLEYPAVNPITVPIPIAKMAERNPTIRAILDPHTN